MVTEAKVGWLVVDFSVAALYIIILFVMKVRELNRQIFNRVSSIQREDYLWMLHDCYRRCPQSSNRESALQTCMQKWESVFAYVSSEDMLESYTEFFRTVRK